MINEPNCFYELKLINTITKLINIDTRDQPRIYRQFINNQKNLLINKLQELQGIESDSLITEETQRIIVDNFDHPEDVDQESNISEGDNLYSLRSWVEYYLNIDYDTAYELSIDHCKNIKSKYLCKYNKNPIKICKEWIYRNDEKIKQVCVNSFSRLEFIDIIKPYLDINFMTETHI